MNTRTMTLTELHDLVSDMLPASNPDDGTADVIAIVPEELAAHLAKYPSDTPKIHELLLSLQDLLAVHAKCDQLFHELFDCR